MTSRAKMAEAWLAYAEGAGLSALPLCPAPAAAHAALAAGHVRACGSPGKRPPFRWKRFQAGRMTRGEFREYVGRFFPPASPFNVGAVTGAVSGLVGVDLDGPDAVQWLHAGVTPAALETASFATGRGVRLLYRLPPGVALASVAAGRAHPRAELLAEGRVTVLPPSAHPSGATYRWARGCGPRTWARRCVELPAEVLAAFRPRHADGTGHAFHRPGDPDGLTFREGGEGGCPPRNSTLFAMACALRRRGASRRSVFDCLAVLDRQCRPPLGADELRRIAASACRYAAHPY